MYGHVERENRGRLMPGQDLVVVGTIGLRGAASIARAEDARMRAQFSGEFVRRLQELDGALFEGSLEYFEKFGATECEKVSEGGIMAALWNLTGAYQVGMEIELRRIPILQETVEVCEVVDVNPYRLWSEGCYLLASDSAWGLIKSLESQGINGVTIGRVTKGSKRLIFNGEGTTYLDRPQKDELWKILPEIPFLHKTD